jgi:5-methyltetrahydrofolate--homocysteine methyltransferase
MAGMTADQSLHWRILHRKKEGVGAVVDAAIRSRGQGHAAAVDVLNTVLLPAMKEVGDKFGAGELILPFVLQSAEVMKRAVLRLEEYLEKVEGRSKATVVLATVFGDVHDIGKNLVHTILENNGYTVHDLGRQVPINAIIEKAEEVGADAIGLSALLVSTSKQMPRCVQELAARNLKYPVLLGGAAINPSFVRSASFADTERTRLYESGVFYCKDAFEGLSTLKALLDPEGREAFIRERLESVSEGIARRKILKDRAVETRAPLSSPPLPEEVPIPQPAFLGTKILERLPLEDAIPLVDLNTLYRLHWGGKNAKGDRWEALVREEFQPRFVRYRDQALGNGRFQPRAAFGIFPAGSDGNELVIFSPQNPDEELARFSFPRQADRDRLCLADYFRPADRGERDVVAFQVVTLGDDLLRSTEAMMKGGEYSEGYCQHGFGVRLVEAGAELVHRMVRRELGIPEDQGLRYSWGYGACPDPLQHGLVFRLLEARKSLRMGLTTAGALVPDLSTAALVVHHPRAKYFSV